MASPGTVRVDVNAIEIHLASTDRRVIEHFAGIEVDDRVSEAERVVRLGVETADRIGIRSETLGLVEARREIVEEARAIQAQLAKVAAETGEACKREIDDLRARGVEDLTTAVRQATGSAHLADVVAEVLVGSSSPLAAVETRMQDAVRAMEVAHRRGLDSAVRQLGDVATHLSRLTGTLEANQSLPARGGAYEDSVANQLAAVVTARGDRIRDVRSAVGHDGSKKGDYLVELDGFDLRLGVELKDTKVGSSAEAARDLINQICDARDADAALIVTANEAAMPTGLRGVSVGLVGERGVAVCIEAGANIELLRMAYSMARALAVVESRRREASRYSPDLESAGRHVDKLRRRLVTLAESESKLRGVARDASAESKRIGKMTREALSELESLADEIAKALPGAAA